MDLFGARAETIRLPGADLFYMPALFEREEAESILAELIRETPWKQERIRIWGKEMDQPRLTAWYGDPGKGYSYSGVKLSPLPWTLRLLDLKRRTEQASDATYNSVLLNYYRDEHDSLGDHSDDEKELGEQPAIASLSFGAERAMRFKPKAKLAGSEKPVSITLHSGSMLVMRGETQKFWKHGIAKTTRKLGPRVNLTFRSISHAL